MSDRIAKQLIFSPDPPAADTAFNVPVQPYNVVNRLDGQLMTAWEASSAFAGVPQNITNRKGNPTFKVPSDDEDEFDDPDSYEEAMACRSSTTCWLAASQQLMITDNVNQLGSGSFFNGSMSNTSGRLQHPVQAILQARQKQLQAGALLLAEHQHQRLHQQIQSVEQQLAQQLQEVQQQLQLKRARAAAADEESRLVRSAERLRRLQEVQRQQQALEQAGASALQGVKRAQEEAARQRAETEARLRQQQEEERRKREAEAAEQAAAAKAAEEAKARDAAAAAAKAAQEQQQQQQQASVPPAAAAAQRPGPDAALSNSLPQHVKSTAAALQYEQLLAAKLAEAEAAAAELTSKPELKQQRRALEKQITMAVSQISGTQQQVQDKSKQLIQVLSSCSTPQQQALAYVTLASRVVSQCEGQVQKIGSFAFPLAYVCVAVGAAVPHFMELLLAKLQKACPLLVPRYTMYSPDQAKDEWFKTLGYMDVEDNKTRQMRRETSDEFVLRMSSMVLLYGAIVQTDAPGNPAGLAHGWAWLARCLNSLPPTRPTATALMSFLAHAGHRMAAVYGRQFQKLMLHLTEHYLPALEAKASKDADLRAVGTRLQTYVTTQQFMKEPEGRTLKKVDESSYTRA